MIDGVPIRMNGQDYVVPPLSLKAIKRLQPTLDEIRQCATAFEALPKIAEVVHAALQRNYPEITIDQMDDLLDMGNAFAVLNAVQGVSGFVRAGETAAASNQ